MTDEARAAANAYQRRRRRESRETMTDEAKETHREYCRDWRKKNPEKVREYNARYWAKKAALKAYVLDFHKRFPEVRIIGHREVANKACPSFDVQKWLKEIGINQ